MNCTNAPGVTLSALVDTGNSFDNLLSFSAFQKLNIKLLQSSKKAVSVDNSAIKILGRTPVLDFKFVGSDRIFQIAFEVLKDMNCDINLSYNFLSYYNSVILFDEREGNNLHIGNVLVPLVANSHKCLDFINSIITHISPTFESEWSNYPGINFCDTPQISELNETKYIVRNLNKVKLQPKTITPIQVSPSVNNGYCSFNNVTDIYLTPITMKNTYITKAGLLPLESIYRSNNGELWINVINCNDYATSLPPFCKVGYMHSCTTSSFGQVNSASHSIEALSDVELFRRVAFITKELNLKNNPITANNSVLRGKIVKLFLDNFNAVALNNDDVGETSLLEFNIDLKPDATPVYSKNFPLNPDQSKALRIQIQKWLNAGVIRPCVSSWSSPIFSVKKKTAVPGKFDLRFVLDFRKLNSCTKDVIYPIPSIEQNLGKLGGARLFSTLDAVQAYHTIKVAESSQEYLAFSSEDEQYTFCRMPFGTKGSASVFQRLINKALSLIPGIAVYCVSYLDDLIVFSRTLVEHLKHLQIVLELMNKCGLKFKLSKCHILQSSVKYLGHVVSSNSIKMDPYYLERIKAWSIPKTGKEMQSYLGFLNYYRNYIPNFALFTYKLDELRNLTKITWTNDLIKVFEDSKALFHDKISRGYPDWNPNASKFLLDIDWSKNAMAGVLSQNQRGQEIILGAFSRRCSKAEQNYSSHKGEAAALVYSMEKFSHFLRYRSFIIRTDSRSVLTTSNWNVKLLTGVTARWLQYIATFNFEIIHRSGHLHKNADILSRSIIDTNDNDLPADYIMDPLTKQNSKYLDTVYALNLKTNVLGCQLDVDLWVKETNNDHTLSVIKQWVKDNYKPLTQDVRKLNYRGRQLSKIISHLIVLNELLVFVQPSRNMSENEIRRTVVPISLYDLVFEYAHINAMTNHRGIVNTLNFSQRLFAMPMAKKYFTARINNCVTCLNKVSVKPKSKHIIQHSDFCSIPMESINIDTIGPLTPCTFHGKKVMHILIIVDACTRYLWLYPLENITTECIVDAICEEFIPIFTLFRFIKSDHGPCFISKIWEGIYKKLGINKRYSVVRNPNSNFSERANQNVYSMFRTDNRFMRSDWASKLKFVSMAYNSSKNSRTTFSPHFMLFKKDPVLPLNLIDPLNSEKLKLDFHSKSFDKFIFKIEETYNIMKSNTDRYLAVENSNKEHDILHVNDMVYYFEDVLKIGLSKKLNSFFIGPFIISHVFSNSLYELTPIPPNLCKRVIVAARDKIRKIEGKVDLGKEMVGFNVNPSRYINIDSDIQLQYLNDVSFQNHLVSEKNIINGNKAILNSDSANDSNSDSDTEFDTDSNFDNVVVNNDFNENIVHNDSNETLPNHENRNLTDMSNDLISNQFDIPTNNKQVPDSIVKNDVRNDTILVQPPNKLISGKSFIQLSRRNKGVVESNKLSLRDLYSKRKLRSANSSKLFSFDVEKPFKGFK